MRIPPGFLDEIRDRLPLSEVVGRRVTWDKRKSQPGKGDFWACCPFHQERSPSFHVEDRKGFYHCFGCGASGDHVKFLTETEGLSFTEAVERLADMTGMRLPEASPEDARRSEQRRGVAEAVAAAQRFFAGTLMGPAGERARAYARSRRLTGEIIAEFGIGAAPAERNALTKALSAEGYSDDLLVEAGLSIRPDDGRGLYDRFRDRLMIPIQDERGRPVAFGGRALTPAVEPKYLNSPETPLFSKGTLLFNAHRARAASRGGDPLVVVEGYLDAIAVSAAGLKSVVASLGTALTEDQIRRLWRYSPEPVLCLDGDRAGIAAAHRAIDRILPLVEGGRSVNFVFLTSGKDPDDVIAAGGLEAFRAELARARPLVEVVWERETEGQSFETPERRALLERRLDELAGTIQDQLVSKLYRQALRDRMFALFPRPGRPMTSAATGAGPGAGSERPFPPRGGTRTGFRAGNGRDRRGSSTGDPKRDLFANAGSWALPSLNLAPPEDPKLDEHALLGLAILRPDLAEAHADRLAFVHLTEPGLDRLRTAIEAALGDEDETAGTLAERLEAMPEVAGALADVIGPSPGPGQPGANLVRRVPILAFTPPPGFVADFFALLLERLEIRTLEAEHSAEIDAIDADSNAEDMNRLMELNAEIRHRKGQLVDQEREMAEFAKAIRRGEAGG